MLFSDTNRFKLSLVCALPWFAVHIPCHLLTPLVQRVKVINFVFLQSLTCYFKINLNLSVNSVQCPFLSNSPCITHIYLYSCYILFDVTYFSVFYSEELLKTVLARLL